MNNKLHRWLLTFTCATTLLTPGGLLSAQEPVPQIAAGEAQITTTKANSASAAPMVPFSASEIRETTQTLADGTQIIHKNLTKLFRDSEGRTHGETYLIEGGSSQPPSDSPKYIFIYDPVAGVLYNLDPRDHTAHRTSLTPDKPAGAGPAAASAPRPKVTEEALGQQEIEGVTAQSVRITRMIPVGADGNDRPIVVTEEVWLSPRIEPAGALRCPQSAPGRNDYPPHQHPARRTFA